MLATVGAGDIFDHFLVLLIALATIWNTYLSHRTQKSINGMLAKKDAATKAATDEATAVAMGVSNERQAAAHDAGEIAGRNAANAAAIERGGK